MNNFPKISIITPVYNRVQYLEATILSVVSQNYPNLEYIIIDGGSTDGTIDIIKKHQSQLTYWESEPDKGMYYALQKGFDKATGDIMAWLNSDDMYHPNSLFVVADIFKALPNIEWITGTPSLYNNEGQCVKVFPTQKWSKKRFLAGDYRWIQQESNFWRKSLWEKAGSNIDVNYELAADFELWTRFFEYATLNSVNTVLSGFRMHGDQLSLTNSLEYENEVKIIYDKYFEKNRSIKQMLYVKLFKFRNNCKDSNFIFGGIGNLIAIVLKKTYKLPGIISFDFDNNKWRL